MTLNPFQLHFKLSGNPISTSSNDFGNFTLQIDQGLPCAIERFSSQIRVALIEGEHAVNASKRSAKFGISPNTYADIHFELSENEGSLSLHSMDIQFSTPIRLLNIFTTLDELSALFAETPSRLFGDFDVDEMIANNELLSKADAIIEANAKKLKDNAKKYADRLSNTNAWKFIKDAADKGKISENIEKSKEYSKELLERGKETAETALDNALHNVELAALKIALDLDDDAPSLAFWISGEVALNSRIKRAFSQYKIPYILVPAFSPKLQTLLDQFCLDRDQGGNLARTILAMIHSANGESSAIVRIGNLPVSLQTRQGWQIDSTFQSQANILCKAKIHIMHNADLFDAQIDASITDSYKNGAHPQNPPDSSTRSFTFHTNVHPDSLIQFGHALSETWTTSLIGNANDIGGTLTLHEDFIFHTPSVQINAMHPMLKNESHFCIKNAQFGLSGNIHWGIQIAKHLVCIHAFSLDLQNLFSLEEGESLAFLGHKIDLQTHTFQIHANIDKQIGHPIRLHAMASSDFHINFQHALPIIPEFDLTNTAATCMSSGCLAANISCNIDNLIDQTLRIVLDNSDIHLDFQQLSLHWSPLCIDLNSPSRLSININEAKCSLAGISDCDFDLHYQAIESPILSIHNDATPLLPDEFNNFNIHAHITPNGILRFDGGDGFYDAVFFNTLLHPNSERDNWLKILQYKPLCQHILRLAQITIFPKIDGANAFCSRISRGIQKCSDLDIFSTAQLIHPPTLARAISIMLFNDESATEEILPSILRIYNADGLDRFKLEELIDRAFPNANLDYVGRLLKWLQHLFQTVDYTQPTTTFEPALCDDERFQVQIAALPTANEIYEEDWNVETQNRIYTYAAGLNCDQIQWILNHKSHAFADHSRFSKLKTLLDIKRKILNLETREGTFIIQDFNINVFLGALLDEEMHYCDNLGLSPNSDDVTDLFRSWLAPIDIAILITAGISSRYHGIFVQINQARLWDYLKRRGPRFAYAVFYEIGRRNDRVLANMLMSWLSQDQAFMKFPVDRPKELSNLLHIEIPDDSKFTPWSDSRPASYIQAIFDAAERVNTLNDPYCAARLRLESYRCTPPAQTALPPDEEIKLANAIQRAQCETQRLIDPQNIQQSIDQLSQKDWNFARETWQCTFESVRHFAQSIADPWQYPVFKDFWARTIDALRIASVLDDVQNDYDETRIWLNYHLKTSQNPSYPKNERECSFAQKIIAIVDFIFARDEDKKAILLDPLTWFMPTPKKGNVSLTLVTAMGIITNGTAGHELETVFERLKNTRNIDTRRTNTGTIQPIQYNAAQIIRVIETIDTPFAMIGYSQGCPNMMKAEANLFTGTPDKRKLLNNLVSRNFICSAFNGSPHATCGVLKYKYALIEGENILKSLSTALSKPLYKMIFSLIQRILDTPLINASLTSVEAISHEGLLELARDAQYAPHVPSIENSGMTQKLPEGLILMANHFDKQAHMPNDSQIGIDCAHAYPVYNENPSVKVLKNEAISPRLLNIHHWSPLVKEVQFLESPKDIQECDYKGPKSIFITPWIDSLILFGILPIRV